MSYPPEFIATLHASTLEDLPDTALLDSIRGVLLTRDVKEGLPMISKSRTIVRGDQLSVRLDVSNDGGSGASTTLCLTARVVDQAVAPEFAVSVLSDIVLSCLHSSRADRVAWLDPRTTLDRDEFIALRSYVSPRRRSDGTQRVADLVTIDAWDRAEVNLARMYQPASQPAAGSLAADDIQSPDPVPPPTQLGRITRKVHEAYQALISHSLRRTSQALALACLGGAIVLARAIA